MGGIRECLLRATSLERVRYMLFSQADYGVFAGALWELANDDPRVVVSV